MKKCTAYFIFAPLLAHAMESAGDITTEFQTLINMLQLQNKKITVSTDNDREPWQLELAITQQEEERHQAVAHRILTKSTKHKKIVARKK